MKHNKRPEKPDIQRRYITTQTALYLYPWLPLDQLSPNKDGLYDAIAIYDLAQSTQRQREPANPPRQAYNPPGPEGIAPFAPNWKPNQQDQLIVNGKTYFSTLITSHRTGETVANLRRLARDPDNNIGCERRDIPNGTRGALFFDIDSVLDYQKHRQ